MQLPRANYTPAAQAPVPPMRAALPGAADRREAVEGNCVRTRFSGTGQMFSSTRDFAILLAAELGELAIDPLLRDAMAMTQRGVFAVSARSSQALAWEINDYGGLVIIDKPGGLNNASTYIGLVAGKRLGIVILVNRGEQYLHDAARERILPALAR